MAEAVWPTAPRQTNVHCIHLFSFSSASFLCQPLSKKISLEQMCGTIAGVQEARKRQQKESPAILQSSDPFRVSKWKSRRYCLCQFQWSDDDYDDDWLCIQVARPTKSRMEVTQRHTFPILLIFARTSRKTTKTMVNPLNRLQYIKNRVFALQRTCTNSSASNHKNNVMIIIE